MNAMFPTRLKETRNKKGLTQKTLAKVVSVEPNTVYKWEKGLIEPSTDSLDRISDALEVSADFLLGKAENSEVVSNVATMNDAMMIPVVTNDVSACCGKGNMYAEDVKWEIVGYYPIDPNDLIGYTWLTKDFCIIRADGDSMEPHIHDGDRILFAKSPDVEVLSGNFAILLWDGRILIRGMIFPDKDKVILRPTNDDYKDIETTRDDERLCVLGKVLGVTPAYRKTPGLW